MNVAEPASELLEKAVSPQLPSSSGPLLLVTMPSPAVEVPLKNRRPPDAPLAPSLLVKVPLPAFEASTKVVEPPPAPLTVLPVLVKIALPAVDVSPKAVLPPLAPLT